MNLVVAVDRNWAIGKDGQLLVHNKYDLNHFKLLTTGKIVVYGRKTLETFPGGRPLKNRQNLILTRKTPGEDGFSLNTSPDSYVEATVIHDITDLDHGYPSDRIYVIGGASVYQQLYQKCKYAFVTHFDIAVEGADAFFPDLSKDPNWKIIEETPPVTYDGVTMRFVTYRNNALFPEKDVD